MPVNLHLFSSSGEDDIRYIVEASRPYFEGRDEPTLAYLPMASLSDAWLAYVRKAFHGLAKVEMINTETMTFAEMESILRKAHALSSRAATPSAQPPPVCQSPGTFTCGSRPGCPMLRQRSDHLRSQHSDLRDMNMLPPHFKG
jgi:hypothetical protein